MLARQKKHRKAKLEAGQSPQQAYPERMLSSKRWLNGSASHASRCLFEISGNRPATPGFEGIFDAIYVRTFRLIATAGGRFGPLEAKVKDGRPSIAAILSEKSNLFGRASPILVVTRQPRETDRREGEIR
jgi:hypothetical protein